MRGYPAFGQPSFALVLKGPYWLAADGFSATILESGDFGLFPAMPEFTLVSDPEVKPKSMIPKTSEQVDELFHGVTTTDPSVILLGGYFAFDPIIASLLLDLLPRMLHRRATEPTIDSVVKTVELIQREAREKRAGRMLVLTRLIEVMLVEALRSVPSDLSATDLRAGLRNPKPASALRGIHTQTAHPWTLATLAREAGMSRSSLRKDSPA